MLVPNQRLGEFKALATDYEAQPRSGFLDLRGFWFLLRRHAHLIVAVLLAALILAGATLVALTPQYFATAVILVDPRQQKVVQSEAVLSGIGSDAAAVESQVEVIRSNALISRVIEKLRLVEDPEFTQPGLAGRISALLGRKQVADPEKTFARVAALVQDRLWVQRRGLTYVIEVGFRSADPNKAASISNAIASEYLNEQAAAKQGATETASDWLDQRIAEMRARVAQSERAIATYKANHNIVDTGEGRTLMERQISELNQQLILSRARTAETRARFEQVKHASAVDGEAGSPPEALASQVIANLRIQYAQAAKNEVELLRTFGPRYPALQTNTEQMADLRRQIQREIGRISAGLRSDYEAAQSREKSLEASLAALKRQAAASDQDAVQLRELERDAAASRTLLQQYLLRAKETTEQQTLKTPDAKILSSATPPLNPNWPRPGLLLGFALSAGLILGVGSAAVAESLGRGFRTVAEVQAVLGQPVLALLPGRDAAQASGQGARSLAAGVRAVGASLRLDRALSSQIVVVTSALPGEDGSLLAASLAGEIAGTGRPTLLVKLDPWSTPASGNGADMERVLEAQRHGRPIRSLVRRDRRTGLHVLPLGAASEPRALDLLTGQGLDRLAKELRQDYQSVIVDAAPILTSVGTQRLLDHADIALVALRWGTTEQDSAIAALKSIEDNLDKVAGIVLTGVDLKRFRFYDRTRPYGTSERLAV